MTDPYATEPVHDLQSVKGVDYPLGARFRQLLITGPPGAGKSTQNQRIGGWPEEGCVDLSVPRWWSARELAIRPREVHLALPFVGIDRAITVFDPQWLEAGLPALELERLLIPPGKRHFLSVDWRSRYLFEFLLPPAATIHKTRLQRREKSWHPDDESLDADSVPPLIEAQVEMFRQVALYMYQHGVSVIVRSSGNQPPRRFIAERLVE